MTVGYDPGAQGRRSMGTWLALVAVVAAAVGGLWWYTRGRQGVGGGGTGGAAESLATAAPADAQVFLAFDVREKFPTIILMAKLQLMKAQFPDLAKSIDEVEKQSGVTVEEVSRWASPAGYIAIMPREGEKSLIPADTSSKANAVEVVMASPVSDEEAARQTIDKIFKKSKTPPKMVDQDGVKMWVVSQDGTEMAFCVANKYVFSGTGPAALSRALKAASGKAPNLAAQPQFIEARKKIATAGAVLGYVAVRDAIGPIGSLPAVKQYVDDQTMEALTAMQYLIGGSDIDGASHIFLRVDAASKSAFVKAMLTPQPLSSSIATFFPASWGNYASFNAGYLGSVIYQAIMLVPSVRSKVALGMNFLNIRLGFNPAQEFMKMSNGDVGYSSDVIKLMPQVMGGNFEQARGRGQLTACASNLKNIGTAAEMFSTDNQGHYPKALSELTPNYLKTIPTCPAAGSDTYSSSWRSSTGPDRFEVACGGHHHAAAGVAENMPAYNSMQGLTGMPSSTADRTRMPNPTVVFAISLKDANAANDLIGKIEKISGMTSQVSKSPSGADVHSYAALPLRWTVATQPAPALLISSGPEADARLDDALKSGGQAKDSVEALSDYQALMKDAKGKAEQTAFVDLTPLMGTFSDMIKTMPKPPNEKDSETKLRLWLAEKLKDAPPVNSTSVLSVEPDGLSMRSRGYASPLIAGSAMVAAIVMPNLVRARGQGQTTACKSNLKNIGTALEMYSTDNSGRFPLQLSQLTPNYLKTIPTCPSAGHDTYSASYASASNPDGYTVVCAGTNHSGASYSPNYPQYTSTQGILER